MFDYRGLIEHLYKMSVINCKVKYLRDKKIQGKCYQNLREWMEDKDNVYVGRAGIVFIDDQRYPDKSSPFANKYKIGPDGDRQQVLRKYKRWLMDKVLEDDHFREELMKLKGKNLGCWCHPENCHANIIQEMIQFITEIE